MARKQWEALSSSYRGRLERKGITAAAYERGVSLAAARGHKNTPERPVQAQRNPKRYSAYVRSRQPMRVITTNGIVAVDGLNRRDRSTVAKHLNAAGRYLDTGNTTTLNHFEGATVGGYRGIPAHELETRLNPIEDYALVGRFNVDSIYEKRE